MRRRLYVLLALALAMALVAPAGALGYNWVKSPTSPLVRGGVHSQAKFEDLLLHSSKVRSAVKAVLKADGYPSWVFAAAIQAVQDGDVYSNSLSRGTNVGFMAFGPNKTKIIGNTIWKGHSHLPYYFVRATKVTFQGSEKITTSYRVCLAKTCGNPFVFDPLVTRVVVKHNLYVEKRLDTPNGTLLPGWVVTGTVDGAAIKVTTVNTGPVLVGSYAAGTPYVNVHETLQEGWQIVSPPGGTYTGTMPDHDYTLVFVNRRGDNIQ